jgi:hypothetical protein
MSNKSNYQYDADKKMLNTLRALNEAKSPSLSRILREDLNVNQQPIDNTTADDSDFNVVDDVQVKIISSDKLDFQLTNEEKGKLSQLISNFKQQVDDLAELDPGFNIDVTQSEFRLDGKIPDQDITFVMTAGNANTGVYVNADMLKLTDDVLLTLSKLNKFQHGFSDAASNFITSRKNN